MRYLPISTEFPDVQEFKDRVGQQCEIIAEDYPNSWIVTVRYGDGRRARIKRCNVKTTIWRCGS